MRSFRDLPDERLIEVCEAYLRDTPSDPRGLPNTRAGSSLRNMKQLAGDLNARWDEAGIKLHISREQIYVILGEARNRGLFRIVPRAHDELRKELCARYSIPLDRVQVVSTDSHVAENVVYEAARLVVAQIFELWPILQSRGAERVHIGLGAGHTTRVASLEIAKLLRESGREIPPLTLHAISSGYNERMTPLAFFGFFENIKPEVELVGLFAEPFVAHDEFEEAMKLVGSRRAYNSRYQIDIVVTSLGCFDDVHSSVAEHMKDEGGFNEVTTQLLSANGWRGDLHLRPFNQLGPIIEDRGNRAVTLFEISDFVTMARDPSKRVVVVSPPCHVCGLTRAPALQLLLTVQQLKAWTHLVTDVPTARELIALANGQPVSRKGTHTAEPLDGAEAARSEKKAKSATAKKDPNRLAAGESKRKPAVGD
jgi:DNA-binding transcriptional regulator LsrR (DeoR family)